MDNWIELSAATQRALSQRNTQSPDAKPEPAENQADKHNEEDASAALESIRTRLKWLNWLQFALSRKGPAN